MTSAVNRLCFLLFPNVDVDWYLLHLPREPPNHNGVHVTSLSCCIVSRKSDTILPPQEIQLEDGKSRQTPPLEPASGWDLWHKLSLQCLEMLHTQQLLLARIVKLKKARVFYNWQVYSTFLYLVFTVPWKSQVFAGKVPQKSCSKMLRFDFTNFNKYTLK